MATIGILGTNMTASEIVEKFIEAIWNQRQLDLIDDLFPPDFTAKPIAYQPMWNGMGPESMKNHIKEWLEGVPDLHMKTIDIVAQDNKVSLRWEMIGTHNGVLYGVPPTGRGIKALGVTLFEVENSKIRELRTLFDGLGLMQQLGVLPDPGTLIRSYLSHLKGSQNV